MKRFFIILTLSSFALSAMNPLVIASLEQALETLAQLTAQAQTTPSSNSPASLETQVIINALREYLSQTDLLTLQECATLLAQLASIELALHPAPSVATVTSPLLTTTV